MDFVERFLLCLHGKRVCRDEEDMVQWIETRSCKFTVKSLYNILKPDNSVCFPLRIIWNLWVQPKLCFFAWEATWGNALTLDEVQRRGWSLVNRCYLC